VAATHRQDTRVEVIRTSGNQGGGYQDSRVSGLRPLLLRKSEAKRRGFGMTRGRIPGWRLSGHQEIRVEGIRTAGYQVKE